jgi:hypothetical protein
MSVAFNPPRLFNSATILAIALVCIFRLPARIPANNNDTTGECRKSGQNDVHVLFTSIVLTNFAVLVYIPRHPIPQEGALPGTLRSAGSDAAPEGGSKRGSSFAGVLGYPSGPTIGVCHLKLAGRGQAAARNRREPSPRKRGPGLLRRDGTSRGVAVCLCFPAIREIRRGCYQVRLSAFRLPLLFRGRFTEPSNHAKGFAGSDDARLQQRSE